MDRGDRGGTDYYNDSSSRISLETEVLGVEKRLEAKEQSSESAADFLRILWCAENLIDFGIRLCYSSFTDGMTYTMSVAFKDINYQCEKQLFEICNFYTRLKGIFKELPFPELPVETFSNRDVTTALDEAEMKQVRDWFYIILNDGDFFCSELHKFFGCEFMKIFAYTYQLNRIHYRQPRPPITMQERLIFELWAGNTQYRFEAHENDLIRMVKRDRH